MAHENPPPETRRDRLRRQTLGEIKGHALAQIDAGGAAALSLNAVGKAMGMSGPAVYRYFPSREALLAAVVTDGYAELTATLEQAERDARRRSPERRLTAVAEAYRGWAVARPQRYALLFGLRPAGYADPDEALAAIQGAMEVLLRVLAAIAAESGEDGRGADRSGDVDGAARRPLDADLVRWARSRRGPDDERPEDPHVLRLGVLAWTRLHGLVGLELAGVFGDMDLAPEKLVAAELGTIAEAARNRRPRAGA